jgi:hypothetical protein
MIKHIPMGLRWLLVPLIALAWTMVSGTILCVGAPWEETVVVDLLFLEKIVQGAAWVVNTP